MQNTSVTKVSSEASPRGESGQRYLASGIRMAMRLWDDEQPGEPKQPSRRDYETVGFVLKGRAELHIEGQTVLLAPGDSWVVNQGQEHTYKILEPFTAVEVTSPPARVHGREGGRLAREISARCYGAGGTSEKETSRERGLVEGRMVGAAGVGERQCRRPLPSQRLQ